MNVNRVWLVRDETMDAAPRLTRVEGMESKVMAIKKSVEPATKQIETEAAPAEAVTKGFGETIAALKTSMTGAAAGFKKTQEEVKMNMDKAIKTAEEMVSFGQGNVEAIVKSGQIWSAGVQDLSKSFAATAQAQLDQTVATMKALAGVKSLKEAIDLQANLTRNSVETAVAQTGKLTDASMKLAEQAFAPITARVTLAVEKFGRAA
ncbi:MAG: phasin family protein [Rhodospirillales bacterium]|nr:TIGR01841 family phasin [Rhodospirillales bacterium]MDE2576409.1 phasin family protein [Rhodospirillales bacterium]